MQTLKSTGCVLDVRAAPGNTFIDASRYHHTITNNNVVTVKGMGDALAGGNDGATAYLDCGNHASLNITDAITIEAWVKPHSSMDGKYICAKTIAGDPYTTYGFVIISDKFRGRIQSTGGAINCDADNTYTIDSWYFVNQTYDGIIGKLYVNGLIQADTESVSGTITTTSTDFIIAAYNAISLYFNGSIFLARIYNRALPASEILDHYYEYAPLLGLD